jgi:hypothetical protein
VEAFRVDTALLDALEPLVARTTELEITRSGEGLYVTAGGRLLEGKLERIALTT